MIEAHRDPGMNRVPANRRPSSRARRWATTCTLGLGIVLTVLLGAHQFVPDLAGIALVWESALLWSWLLLPLLLIGLLVARTPGAIVGFVAPTLVWTLMFGGSLMPLGDTRASVATDDSLTVASQNLGSNGDPAAIAATVAASGADLIALQELSGDDRDRVESTLAAEYPHSVITGTVGLWSRYPIVDSIGLKLGLAWHRAINAVVETPSGLVSIYVVHAGSARPGAHQDRDTMLAQLADEVGKNTRDKVIVMGDFNAAPSDRALAALQSEVSEPNQSEGGFGLTWPADTPLLRLDHVFARGLRPIRNGVLEPSGSDHRGVVTSFDLTHRASRSARSKSTQY